MCTIYTCFDDNRNLSIVNRFESMSCSGSSWCLNRLYVCMTYFSAFVKATIRMLAVSISHRHNRCTANVKDINRSSNHRPHAWHGMWRMYRKCVRRYAWGWLINWRFSDVWIDTWHILDILNSMLISFSDLVNLDWIHELVSTTHLNYH